MDSTISAALAYVAELEAKAAQLPALQHRLNGLQRDYDALLESNRRLEADLRARGERLASFDAINDKNRGLQRSTLTANDFGSIRERQHTTSTAFDVDGDCVGYCVESVGSMQCRCSVCSGMRLAGLPV